MYKDGSKGILMDVIRVTANVGDSIKSEIAIYLGFTFKVKLVAGLRRHAKFTLN